MPKPIEPEHFKVLERKTVMNRGKERVAFKLRYDASKFKDAGCRGLDTELFYPDKNIFSREEERVFQNMCIDCPAFLACLEWAMCHEKEGIWAGTTPHQRMMARASMGLQVVEPMSML